MRINRPFVPFINPARLPLAQLGQQITTARTGAAGGPAQGGHVQHAVARIGATISRHESASARIAAASRKPRDSMPPSASRPAYLMG